MREAIDDGDVSDGLELVVTSVGADHGHMVTTDIGAATPEQHPSRPTIQRQELSRQHSVKQENILSLLRTKYFTWRGLENISAFFD